MKFKLLGTLGVAAVGVMGLGLTNTGAWFTDQETAQVTASSATLDIQLGGDTIPVTVEGLLPGEWSAPYYLEIQNKATSTDAKYRVTSAFTGQSQALFDAMQVRVVNDFCGPDFGTPPDVIESEPTKLLMNLNFNTNDAQPAYSGILLPNWSHCFNFYFRLPPSAGNALQGLTTEFDIVVDATQPSNPGWSE